MAGELNAERQFERKLCEQGGRTLIESHCKQCGKIRLGTAIFGDLLEHKSDSMPSSAVEIDVHCLKRLGLRPRNSATHAPDPGQ
jgi:hypothetical protein